VGAQRELAVTRLREPPSGQWMPGIGGFESLYEGGRCWGWEASRASARAVVTGPGAHGRSGAERRIVCAPKTLTQLLYSLDFVYPITSG
jgi:hypothetical protein